MFEDRRILIFSGGNLGPWALEEIGQRDFLIGVDRGALFLLQNQWVPDIVIGDFDSVSLEDLTAIKNACNHVICCDPVDKDYTDTEMAFNWALEKEPKEIVIFGALGSRFDHSLANVYLLRKGIEAGVICRIVDQNNEIEATKDHRTIRKGGYPYVSILPISLEVKGLTLEGFKYPLTGANMTLGESLTISNVQVEEVAHVKVQSGQVLIIRSKD